MWDGSVYARTLFNSLSMLAIVADHDKKTVSVGVWQAVDISYPPQSENALLLKNEILAANNIKIKSSFSKETGLKDVHKEIASHLGPMFYSRLNGAVYGMWVGPLRSYCDNYCFYSNGYYHRHSPPQVRRLWLNIIEVERAIKDQIDNLAPIIIYFGSTPKDLKVNLGKSIWKILASNSLYKNKQIVELLGELFRDQDRLTSFASFSKCKPLIKIVSAWRVTSITRYLSSYTSPFDSQYHAHEITRFDWLNSHTVVSNTKTFSRDNMLYKDTLDMALHLGYTLNPKWSAIKLRERHEFFSKRINAERFSDDVIDWLSVCRTVASVKNITATLLRTPLDIATEGVQMHHCVANYIERVVAGKYLVISLEDNEGGRSTLGLSFNNEEAKVDQHYGYHNEHVSRLGTVRAAMVIAARFAYLFQLNIINPRKQIMIV
jgi:hypothetical protein